MTTEFDSTMNRWQIICLKLLQKICLKSFRQIIRVFFFVKSHTCIAAVINARSSVGFQRPRPFHAPSLRCFFLFFSFRFRSNSAATEDVRLRKLFPFPRLLPNLLDEDDGVKLNELELGLATGVSGEWRELIFAEGIIFGTNVDDAAAGLGNAGLDDVPAECNKGLVNPGGATTGAVSTISSSNFFRLISRRLLVLAMASSLLKFFAAGLGFGLALLGLFLDTGTVGV